MFPIIPADSATGASGNTEGIFTFGCCYNTTCNLVSDTGVISADVSYGAANTGPAKAYHTATEYGGDKGISGFGRAPSYGYGNYTNLISNTGVVASNVGNAATARRTLAACSYGEDKGMFGFGSIPPHGGGVMVAITNLVSNAGVVASDQAATTGTARGRLAACEYDGDKAIFGFGYYGSNYDMTNLVSNTGVVASDQAATTGTARSELAACSYGGDKGIFGFGNDGSVCDITNLVSNAGVVASDVTGVGTARKQLSACEYGGNKGIFGFGWDVSSSTAVTNLVSNTGVVASDQATVTGTARAERAANSFN